MKTKLDLIKNWMLKADNDLKSARHELTFCDDAVTDTICFHCQQAAEKYLKTYMIFLDIPFEKTHEIGELIMLCEPKDKDIGFLKDTLDILTDYAVEVRYPDNFFLPTFDEAKEALELAEKLREYIINKIG
jgi:HEPN domain-containing protein